ncbi:TIGR03085 family metal-binding protein [Corynebacterium guangdongense]|uniref:Uncharacterized protein (TIGR03085 family) n=1 Tax=Corynebacterium guangdongense TaxID=1783348 RepID=A0ABU1ZX76_9CORY|nr:TIGR03085 family metal-binding protein [Corynebacterium guangdongense]MDR7329542.1 uncharacterized protein (TIGR03085 family) [Corynebacterium guangdongense]WJZ18107.1 hypothetical protein CGUA_07725 [Corynebacterium guangdongense]
MSFSAAERRHLADLLHRTGPDQDTLCEGWSTRDLAAHLYVRENNLLAAGGVALPVLEPRLVRAMEQQKARDFDELVDAWAAGPPRLSPYSFLDSKVNAAEHFVHHEDVRRGGGVVEPREFSRAVEEQLGTALKISAPMMLRGSRLPVVLTPRGSTPIVVGGRRGVSRRGDDVVRVSGAVGELLLWVFGRDAVEVEIDGDVSAVSRPGA